MAEKTDYASAARRLKSKNPKTRSWAKRVIKAVKKPVK
ncbi:putative metal homeostasis protein [Lacticaseibacillus paracasei]|nr:putative metal homeostasis protein [Lacticaseibacillus paracasei]